MLIGGRIRDLREGCNLTLEEVAHHCGVNKATIQRYESGVIDVKRNTAIKLAEVLNSTPAYIMGWSEADAPLVDNGFSWSIPLACAYAKASRAKQDAVCAVLNIDHIPPEPPPHPSPVTLAAHDTNGVDPVTEDEMDAIIAKAYELMQKRKTLKDG